MILSSEPVWALSYIPSILRVPVRPYALYGAHTPRSGLRAMLQLARGGGCGGCGGSRGALRLIEASLSTN
jgi:hypothetical protein